MPFSAIPPSSPISIADEIFNFMPRTAWLWQLVVNVWGPAVIYTLNCQERSKFQNSSKYL